MPAYIAHEDTLCTKMVAFYSREKASDLPSTQATVLLFNPECGNVTAVSVSIQSTTCPAQNFPLISDTHM